MGTIHIILNGHLDPVWLWPWQAGLDAALATCRSACDRLDTHPDIFFTRNEAWLHREVERVDPDLFERMRAFIAAGRWHVVGGWWIQPDCNLPPGFAIDQQIELGKKYFLDRFGVFPRTGYNVDSFGHAASLPTIMRRHGQDRYIMMRPGDHEMALPARVFRWCGKAGGDELTVFRIAGGYCIGDVSIHHVENACTALPPGLDHTMCFIGVGDHGGGPTERQIDWVHENADAIDGWRMEFSTPDRFFDAIESASSTLPLVVGELQHHAIGCYTVHRPSKVLLQRAQHGLKRAEIALGLDPRPEPETSTRLTEGWESAALHQFHDTLGGTCLPSAYEQVHNDLAGAVSVADGAMHRAARRLLNALPDDERQRIVGLNVSGDTFDGYVYHEMPPQEWRPEWRLVDEKGAAVPHQLLKSEAVVSNIPRLLMKLKAQSGQSRVLHVETTPAEGAAGPAPTLEKDAGAAANPLGVRVEVNAGRVALSGSLEMPLPDVALFEDPTDTWSHGIDRYPSEIVAKAEWGPALFREEGPLVVALLREGRIGSSALVAEYRVYVDEPFVEMILHVQWAERHKILKLIVEPGEIDGRLDGIMEGGFERAADGRELPIRDWTILRLASDKQLGITCPDVYAMDASRAVARLTLLRSPLMAHHEPKIPEATDVVFSDRGEHRFRFRFAAGESVSQNYLERMSLGDHRPMVFADLTRGMKP